jgi:HAD superfamily hydrolase (TIGR01509 family)
MMQPREVRLPSGVKWILFDLNGTLLKRVPPVHSVVLAFAEHMGYSFAPKAQRTGLRWVQAYWSSPQSADISAQPGDAFFWGRYIRQYLAAMSIALAVPLPEDELDGAAAVIGHRFTHEYAPKLILAPGAKHILWELREQHLKLGLLSNQCEPLTGLAIELGIIEHFEFTLAAGQAGSRKPDPAFYAQALALAGGVPPEEAVHVGDNFYTDVLGARRAGLVPILLDEQDVFPDAADDTLVIRQLAQLSALLPTHRTH